MSQNKQMRLQLTYTPQYGTQHDTRFLHHAFLSFCKAGFPLTKPARRYDPANRPNRTQTPLASSSSSFLRWEMYRSFLASKLAIVFCTSFMFKVVGIPISSAIS